MKYKDENEAQIATKHKSSKEYFSEGSVGNAFIYLDTIGINNL